MPYRFLLSAIISKPPEPAGGSVMKNV